MSLRPAVRVEGAPRLTAALHRPAVVALALLLASLPFMFSAGVRAERSDEVRSLDPDEAEAAGEAIEAERHEVDGESLVEVALPPGPAIEEGLPDADRLLDTTDDGGRTAVIDQVAGETATLAISQPDGGVLMRDLPGVLAGAFAPDGASLAVIDRHGRLWLIDAATGQGEVEAEGPFSAPLVFEDGGTLLLRAVSSVEAPFQARLLRYDPVAGGFSQLSGDELVYSANTLADGSVAYAAHQAGEGLVIMRVDRDGGVTRLGGLGPRAVEADVSTDGLRIAFAIAGDGVYLVDGPGGRARRLGDGEAPRLSPDGDHVLVRFKDRARVLSLAGEVVTELLNPSAAWLDCQEEECVT